MNGPAPQNKVERPESTNSTEAHASSFYYKGPAGAHIHFSGGAREPGPPSQLSWSHPPWPGPKDTGSGVALLRPPAAEAGGRGVDQQLLLGFQDVEGLSGEAADHGVGVFPHGP